MVRQKLNKKRLAAGVLGSLLAVFVLTAYLWDIQENIRLGYEMGRAESQAEGLKKDIKRLETTKASLLSLERIEKKAREELNLGDIRDGQIIYEDF